MIFSKFLAAFLSNTFPWHNSLKAISSSHDIGILTFYCLVTKYDNKEDFHIDSEYHCEVAYPICSRLRLNPVKLGCPTLAR